MIFLLSFIHFCCYLQYFVGVMAILLGSGTPKVNFYCYLHYFNIRSTDAIYFFFYWISLIWFFYLDFSYWTVLLDFDYHHVLDLGTFEKNRLDFDTRTSVFDIFFGFGTLPHTVGLFLLDFFHWILLFGFSYWTLLLDFSYLTFLLDFSNNFH